MNFELSENQKQAKEEFKKFVHSEIIPYADQYDREENFPRDVIAKLAKKGYLGANIDLEYGGQMMDAINFGLLCEELGKGSASLISLFTVHSMLSQALSKWGSSQQKDKWLPQLAQGTTLGAFALSEPNIGSDANNIETTAIEEQDFYILNGSKKWISCGQLADLFLIFAKCDNEVTAFLVEKHTPGLSIEPINGFYGFRSAMLAQLHFKNCRVPKGNVLGKVGVGFTHIANTALDHGRYCIAWGCVGMGQACLNACLEYTSKRKQFGQLLKDHQLIQQMIAEMITNTKAARMLCLHAGYLKNIKDPDYIMETSLAKYFAAKIVGAIANDAVQIHGANGCSNEYSVQRYLRDAKVTEIIEGSTQIQQIMLSQYAYQKFLFTDQYSI